MLPVFPSQPSESYRVLQLNTMRVLIIAKLLRNWGGGLPMTGTDGGRTNLHMRLIKLGAGGIMYLCGKRWQCHREVSGRKAPRLCLGRMNFAIEAA